MTTNIGASPLVLQILEILGQKEPNDRRREEDARRRRNQGLAESIQAVNMSQAAAAQTPVAEAPQVPFLNHDVASAAAMAAFNPGQTVEEATQSMGIPTTEPQREVMMTTRDGRQIPLRPLGVKQPPLRYKEEIQADKVKDLETERLATGEATKVSDEMFKSMDPQTRSLYPVGSLIPKAVAVQMLRPEPSTYTNVTSTDEIGRTKTGARNNRDGTVKWDEPPSGDADKNSTSGLKGEEYLAALNAPDTYKDLIRKAGTYKSDPTKIQSLRGNSRETFIGHVVQAYPNFDMTKYKARQDLTTDFVSGKSAQNIRSLNTAAHHLDNMAKNAEKLNNSPVQVVNGVKNWLATQAGKAAVSNFEADAGAVETELATVFKNTGATDQEIKSWRDRINSKMSPEQMEGFIKEALALMEGRLSPIQNQWDSVMGADPMPVIFTPESQEIFARLKKGIKGGHKAPAPGTPGAISPAMEQLLQKHNQ